MLTPEERLIIGMQALQRLRPKLRANRAAQSGRRNGSRPPAPQELESPLSGEELEFEEDGFQEVEYVSAEEDLFLDPEPEVVEIDEDEEELLSGDEPEAEDGEDEEPEEPEPPLNTRDGLFAGDEPEADDYEEEEPEDPEPYSTRDELFAGDEVEAADSDDESLPEETAGPLQASLFSDPEPEPADFDEDESQQPEIFLPSLDDVITESGPFPPGSVILGVCDDSLPFTLDLTDPRPGSLLITGDTRSGLTRLLRSILSSAVAINTPGQVSISLISPTPQDFIPAAGSPHFNQIYCPEQTDAIHHLYLLAEMAEQRRRGSGRGPSIILAIDHLETWLEQMDDEAFARLYSLAIHGPRSRVWVIATLSAGLVDQIDLRLLDAFRTRLIGHISSPGLATYLAQDGNSGADELAPGLQFTVPFNEGWIRFWICAEQ